MRVTIDMNGVLICTGCYVDVLTGEGDGNEYVYSGVMVDGGRMK